MPSYTSGSAFAHPERSYITQRLMSLAVELEEERETEKRTQRVKDHEMSQRISQLELERMQSQLACLRMEEQLNQARQAASEAERRLSESESAVAELRMEAAEAEALRKEGRGEQLEELNREIIATRFCLALAMKGVWPAPAEEANRPAPASSDEDIATAGTASALGDWPVHGLERCSADVLHAAAAKLDLATLQAILKPTPILAPMRSSEPSSAAAAAIASDESLPRADDLGSSQYERLLGAALHCAASACASGSASASALASASASASTPASSSASASASVSAETTSCRIAEALISRGASVEWSDARGRTALHMASRRGNKALVALLLQHGADANRRDAGGSTPLHLSVVDAEMQSKLRLRDAVEVEAEAADGPGSASPSSIASPRASNAGAGVAVAESLLRHGADINARDGDGKTALDVAEAAGPAASSPAVRALQDPTLALIASAKRANGLYRAARYADAAECYLQALELTSAASCHAADVATLHFNCARAALKESRHVLALQQAEQAVGARPEYANARMLQAECHMELLEFDAAALAYNVLSELEPNNPAWAECEIKARQLAEAGPYKILGVDRSADAAEIKRAYHQQCLLWHPDKHNATPEAQRRASTMFQRISGAWETLGDESRRAEFDLQHELHELHEQSRAYAGRYEESRSTNSYATSPSAFEEAAYYRAKSDAYYYTASFSPNGFGQHTDENRPPFHHRWSSFNTSFDPPETDDAE